MKFLLGELRLWGETWGEHLKHVDDGETSCRFSCSIIVLTGSECLLISNQLHSSIGSLPPRTKTPPRLCPYLTTWMHFL